MAVFHRGELAVQQRAGLRQQAQRAEPYIRKFMPEQHREFYQQQALIYAGLLDDHGHPWASPMLGERGFISSPNPTALSIEARPVIEAAGLLRLSQGDSLALLGLELDTRRRNRVNGQLSHASEQLLRLSVQQSFGNCPKYIQKRQLDHQQLAKQPQLKADDFVRLSPDSKLLAGVISQCDTFFIASRSARLDEGVGDGVDVSHRGGLPGFVQIQHEDQQIRLLVPDFSGNNFFNTLGNISLDPRVGIYLPDFTTGCSFWIKGRAKIVWQVAEQHHYPGAQRYLQIEIEQALWLKTPLLVQQQDQEFSPALQGTGEWL